MSCQRALELDLVEFLADPRQEAFAEFRAHYPTCVRCAAEVRAWTELEAELGAAAPPAHPDEALLLRWERSRASLGASERRGLEAHLETCASCRDELRALATFDQQAAPQPVRVAGAVHAGPSALSRLRHGLRGLVLHPAVAWGLVVLLAYPAARWVLTVAPPGSPGRVLLRDAAPRSAPPQRAAAPEATPAAPRSEPMQEAAAPPALEAPAPPAPREPAAPSAIREQRPLFQVLEGRPAAQDTPERQLQAQAPERSDERVPGLASKDEVEQRPAEIQVTEGGLEEEAAPPALPEARMRLELADRAEAYRFAAEEEAPRAEPTAPLAPDADVAPGIDAFAAKRAGERAAQVRRAPAEAEDLVTGSPGDASPVRFERATSVLSVRHQAARAGDVEVRVLAPDGRRELRESFHVDRGSSTLRLELPPGWVVPGRHRVEVRTREGDSVEIVQSHPLDLP